MKTIYGIEQLDKNTNVKKVNTRPTVLNKLPIYFENLSDCQTIILALNQKKGEDTYRLFCTSEENLVNLNQMIINDSKLIVSKEKAINYFGLNNYKIFKNLYDYHRQTQPNNDMQF